MLDHVTTEPEDVPAEVVVRRIERDLEAMSSVRTVDTSVTGRNALVVETKSRDLPNDVLTVLAARDAMIAKESESMDGRYYVLVEL